MIRQPVPSIKLATLIALQKYFRARLRANRSIRASSSSSSSSVMGFLKSTTLEDMELSSTDVSFFSDFLRTSAGLPLFFGFEPVAPSAFFESAFSLFFFARGGLFAGAFSPSFSGTTSSFETVTAFGTGGGRDFFLDFDLLEGDSGTLGVNENPSVSFSICPATIAEEKHSSRSLHVRPSFPIMTSGAVSNRVLSDSLSSSAM
mmetsp:Transcript_3060/g.5640  ORF Transcript_3060/g.5640 Transcript_3060/m.5640 type:complete len:203 (-) Transcript_3060:3167-3775(-)